MKNGKLRFHINGKKRWKRRRILSLFGLVFILFALCMPVGKTVGASATDSQKPNSDAEQNLSDSVNSQLENLNVSELEAFLNSLTSGERNIFGNMSFKDKLKGVINGDFKIGYDSFFKAALGLIFDRILNFVPALLSIVAITILYSILNGAKSRTASQGVGKIVHFACISVIAVITTASVTQLILLTRNTVASMQRQMNIVFPILLTVMTALGGTASAAVYQPAVAVLSQVVTGIMVNVILPVFIVVTVLNILGNLTETVRLNKLSDFFGGLSKWIVGIVFTVFTAFLSVQGITAGTHDKVSIRTAKFAISKYVPLIGGYLSEGFNLIMAGGVLIKNAVGFLGVLLLMITVLSPVLTVLVFSLGLKLCAAVLEPLSDGKISNFLTAAGKSLSMLIVIILGVAFMYFITLMLIICTGNQLLV